MKSAILNLGLAFISSHHLSASAAGSLHECVTYGRAHHGAHDASVPSLTPRALRRLHAMHEEVLEDRDLPNELLYGRAGYLFALQFLEKQLSDPSLVDSSIADKVRQGPAGPGADPPRSRGRPTRRQSRLHRAAGGGGQPHDCLRPRPTLSTAPPQQTPILLT